MKLKYLAIFGIIGIPLVILFDALPLTKNLNDSIKIFITILIILIFINVYSFIKNYFKNKNSETSDANNTDFKLNEFIDTKANIVFIFVLIGILIGDLLDKLPITQNLSIFLRALIVGLTVYAIFKISEIIKNHFKNKNRKTDTIKK